MILERVCVGFMQVNCYILAADKGCPAILIDPGDDEKKIKKALQKDKLTPALIVNTHGHYDHIGCDDKFGVPVLIHEDDAILLKEPRFNLSQDFASDFRVKTKIKTVRDSSLIELDNIILKVLHVPGHTPGGIALLMLKPESNILFSGDSLFFRGIGRTDFTGGNEKLLLQSIKEKIFSLPDDTLVYPGHGPASSLGEEKRDNPFFNR